MIEMNQNLIRCAWLMDLYNRARLLIPIAIQRDERTDTALIPEAPRW